ncbi:unnamed protein product [Mytilus edulis]|uniref:Uncharacterized protein n=1 Tax=Mytilus edulis TaxID=6550 RepID=A0A8S3UC88_MYTED|nr:unnamed protein product [Mytilus edulis]
MKSESSKRRVYISAGTIERYIKKYGCEQFVNSFNEQLAKLFQSEKNVANCKWPVIDIFVRPTSYIIENGQIGTATNDCWLIQRLINILMRQESSKHRVDISTWNIERYIQEYGCEQFVNSFNEKLEECIESEEDEIKWNLHLFTTFVRPQSWLGFEKIRIDIQDERVIRYLFLKLGQPTNVHTVKSYIRNYGSDEFITHFNECLKEKVESGREFDFECKWEYLELFFDDNDIDFEGFGIENEDLSDIDLSISIATSSQLEDCEADFNSDSVTSNSSEDSESDSIIDIDSNNHYEDIYNETNYRPSSNNGCKNGVLIMTE